MKLNYERFKKRAVLSILIVHLATMGIAASYYVSETGNDTNSGLNEAAAWKTIAKVNTFAFSAGDQVLFQRGNTFYGSLTIKNSGTTENPITFGAYGIGANPLISGFTSVTGWVNLGSNIWESSAAVSTLATCNMVVINGVNTAMGRTPNADSANGGYLAISSSTGNGNLTSSSLTSTPNWTGAEVVIRTGWFKIERKIITSQSGSTINMGPTIYAPRANYGFFIQNDIRTLDQQNEWYYNPSTKKIRIYSTSQPINVKVSSVESLFTIISNYVTINGISFEGCNSNAITGDKYNTTRTNISVLNSSFNFIGINAIDDLRANFFKVENNTVKVSNTGAFILNSVSNLFIKNNTIENTGLLAGMVNGLDGAISINTISTGIVEGNKILNVGYHGINFYGYSITVKNNYVDRFCTTVDDGGGIYTQSDPKQGRPPMTNIRITGNVILNGITNVFGRPTGSLNIANGIYLDSHSNNIEIDHNSIANCSEGCIRVIQPINIRIHDNLFYNAKKYIAVLIMSSTAVNINNTFTNNILVGKNTTQSLMYFFSQAYNYLPSTTDIYNNNYYTRPVDDNVINNKTFIISQQNLTGNTWSKSLGEWQTFSLKDGNSKKSFQTVSSENDLQFEFNATPTVKTITLSQPMIDVKGTKYSGIISLQPFTSVVLMKDNNPAKQSTEYKSICEGNTYMGWATSGTYERTLTAKSGGDSIVKTYLIVNPKYSISETISIKSGESYMGWNKSGNYVRTLVSVSGCDSIVNTNLIVESPVIITTGGATYYVSNTGNDSNSGLSATAAWETLARVNSYTIQPGDKILFQRGSTFYGALTISNSGTANDPILFGAYGTGANPVISGFTSVSGWTNLGGNIWESSASVSTLVNCNMVVINGKNTAMGRTPNADAANGGYWPISSSTGNNNLTSSSLSGTPNWAGAEVVIRTTGSIIERETILSQSGSTITFSAAANKPTAAYGFFIQNDSRTLDQQNEWYYNPTSKKIHVYSTSQPAEVKVASVENLFTVNSNYITINGISFEGCNSNAIRSDDPTIQRTNISVFNSTFEFIGIYALTKLRANNLVIENNTVNYSNTGAFTATSVSDVIIKNNTIENTGLLNGMVNGVDGAISVTYLTNGIVEGNQILNSGYHGINFYGYSITIKNNFVDGFCSTVDGGGGIYTYTGTNQSRPPMTNIRITGNVIVNGTPDKYGIPFGSKSIAVGIYLNSNTNNVEADNNSVANCSEGCIRIVQPVNVKIHDNLFYDSEKYIAILIMSSAAVNINNTFTNNILVGKNTTQSLMYLYSQAYNYLPSSTDIYNNNYYARPVDDDVTNNKTFIVSQQNLTGNTWSKSLGEWQAFSGKDANSKKSFQPVDHENDLQFHYNASPAASTISLGQPMVDVKGIKYSGGITLQPYSAVVLMKDNNAAKYSTEYKSICDGNSYQGWTSSGTYERTLTSKSGGDSIVTTYLTMNPKNTISETVSIKHGESYLGWTTSGNYVRNLLTSLGCDSIVTTSLIVELPVVVVPGGTVYYVSAAGNDSNSGLSPALAWKSLSKVNSYTFKAGGQILFQRGSTFYGTLTIDDSGVLGNPITFGAYGTGADPVISGFTSVTGWTNLGSNIWESSSPVSTFTTCNMVVVDGANTAMGRMPNADATNGGYLPIASSTGNNNLTCISLTGTPNWTGAEVVVRSGYSIIEREIISSQTGSTIFFSNVSNRPTAAYGFFIQNDPRTLDQQNEWYFNPTTKKIRIFSVSQPTGVKVASQESLYTINSNFITINGISFEGCNFHAIRSDEPNTLRTNISVLNSTFRFVGMYALSKLRASNLLIENNTVKDSNTGAFTANSASEVSIRNNTIENIGLLNGMVNGLDGAINVNTITNGNIEGNQVKNTGYHGINFYGYSITVKNNLVDRFCSTVGDGGGIYTFTSSNQSRPPMTNIRITGNVVLNGAPVKYGLPANSKSLAIGIYLNGNTNNVEVDNNSVANCSEGCIRIVQPINIKVHDNLFYNSEKYIAVITMSSTAVNVNNDFTNNILIGKNATQSLFYLSSQSYNYLPATTDVYNYNYYARPVDDNVTNNKTFIISQQNLTGNTWSKSLGEWQIFSSRDFNSKKSFQSVSSENDLQFEYNANTTAKVINFSHPMIDVKGTRYSGSITLQPFTSVVLMKDNNPLKSASLPKDTLLQSKFIITGSFEERGLQSFVTARVFPNPSSGRFIVSFSFMPETGSRIDIVDLAGRKVDSRVITNQTEEFQLRNHSAGMYLVKFISGSNETVHKLMHQ